MKILKSICEKANSDFLVRMSGSKYSSQDILNLYFRWKLAYRNLAQWNTFSGELKANIKMNKDAFHPEYLQSIKWEMIRSEISFFMYKFWLEEFSLICLSPKLYVV